MPDPSFYLQQVPGVLHQYYAPYRQMVMDPTGVMSRFGGAFQESPGYSFALHQALKGVGQAAAAAGMAGSPEQQTEAAQTATGLANQDYYNYMNHVMNLYMGGARGYSQEGQNLASNLMSQAQLAKLQQEEEERQNESIWGDIATGGGLVLGGLAHLL